MKKKAIHSFVYTPVGFRSRAFRSAYTIMIMNVKLYVMKLVRNMYRPAMPNDQPLFIDAMADVVLKQLRK